MTSAAGRTNLEILLQAKDEASKVLDGVNKSASGLGKTFQDVGKIAAGFGVVEGIKQLGGFLQDAAKGAAEDAASQARLQQAVANTGVAYADYGNTLDAIIEQGQRLAFTDDQTRDSLSLLTAQTGSVEEATKRYALAQDLARGANIDVVTASRLLGKVTEENVNVLARYGISVAEGASETELFGAIQQKFGGQAETFADSQAGAMARINDSIGELQEGIGAGLLPVMEKLTGFVLGEVIPAAQKLVGFLEENKVVAMGLAVGMGVLVAAIAPVPVAIVGIIAAGSLLINHWGEVEAFARRVWGELPGPVQQALDFIRDYIVARIEGYVQVITSGLEIIKGVWNVALDLIHGRWSEAWQGIQDVASHFLDLIVGLVRAQLGNLPEIVVAVGSYLADAGWNAGRRLADSIVDGIGNLASRVADKLSIAGVSLSDVAGFIGGGLDRVPGFAVGTPYVPRDMLAVIHKGEAVIPAAMNPYTQRAGSGGGGFTVVVNHYGNSYGMDDLTRVVNAAVAEGKRRGMGYGFA